MKNGCKIYMGVLKRRIPMLRQYVWTQSMLQEALSYEQAKAFIATFGYEPTIENQLMWYRLKHPKGDGE